MRARAAERPEPSALTGPGAGGPLVVPDPPLGDAAVGIRLRPWTASRADAEALAAAWADPDVAAANRVPVAASPAAATRWLRGEPDRRARGMALDLVVGPSSGAPAVLGEVGLRNVDRVRRRAEVGWWTARGHRGRGVASAAVALLAAWALSPAGGLEQVWCRIDPTNGASAAVARAAGLVRLGAAAGVDVWARASVSEAGSPA